MFSFQIPGSRSGRQIPGCGLPWLLRAREKSLTTVSNIGNDSSLIEAQAEEEQTELVETRKYLPSFHQVPCK
jgi:hypothetical protein